MASSSRNIDDFPCLKYKAEVYALELVNQIKCCTEFDKEAFLHTAKQLCSLKNAIIFLISKYRTPINKSVETQAKKNNNSAKKNNKIKNSKTRLCKATWEEKNEFLEIHDKENTKIAETNFKKQNSSNVRS